jgi:hypothetical protein
MGLRLCFVLALLLTLQHTAEFRTTPQNAIPTHIEPPRQNYDLISCNTNATAVSCPWAIEETRSQLISSSSAISLENTLTMRFRSSLIGPKSMTSLSSQGFSPE